jgi:hypothetical protein
MAAETAAAAAERECRMKSVAVTPPEREQLLDELGRCFARAAVDRLLAEEQVPHPPLSAPQDSADEDP